MLVLIVQFVINQMNEDFFIIFMCSLSYESRLKALRVDRITCSNIVQWSSQYTIRFIF